MRAFHRSRAGAAVLDRADVDTDQIIPKQFLKRIERTGFGEFLFYDWRTGPGLRAEPAGCDGRADPAHRAELRLRLVARARRVGAAGLRLRRRRSRRRSATSSTRTAVQIGLVPSSLPQPEVKELMRVGRTRRASSPSISRADDRDRVGRSRAFRDGSVRPPLPPARARLDRSHAPVRGRHRGIRRAQPVARLDDGAVDAARRRRRRRLRRPPAS